MSQALSKIRSTSLPRRGLSREESAIYMGVSGGTFDQGRADGLIPPPKLWGGRKLWDIRDLDVAFDALPLEGALTAPDTTWDD
jgi:hypothetical protein